MASTTKPEKDSTSPLNTARVDQFFGLGHKILALLREFVEIYRRPFHTAVAWAAVIGGLVLASNSPWTEPAINAAGTLLDELFPNDLEKLRSWARAYKADPAQTSTVIGGVAFAALGLFYHFRMSKFRAGRLDEEMKSLRLDRDHDQAIVSKFYEQFSQAGFEAAIVSIDSDHTHITALNKRAAFWRDHAHSFRAKTLDDCRKRICAAHTAANEAVHQNSPGDIVQAIVRLQQSYLELEKVNQAYADRVAGIERRWR